MHSPHPGRIVAWRVEFLALGMGDLVFERPERSVVERQRKRVGHSIRATREHHLRHDVRL